MLIEIFVTILVFHHCCYSSVFARDIALHCPHPLLTLLLPLPIWELLIVFLLCMHNASYYKKGYIPETVDLVPLVPDPLCFLPCIFLFSLPYLFLKFLKMASTFPPINRNKVYKQMFSLAY